MFVAPPTKEQWSPAALELAQKLTSVIQEFRASHPGVNPRDLQQAIRITQSTTGIGSRQRSALVIAIALLILGLFVGLFFASR